MRHVSTFLVTGGAGFIGSNLVTARVERGDSVRVIDDLSTGRLENLEAVSRDIEFVQADIREVEPLSRCLDGVDFVLHQAAIPSVVRSIDEPVLTHEVNVDGTFGLFMAARAAGVQRVVLAGSSAVYGNAATLPKVETMSPSPLSPYALHKLTCESYGRLFSDLYGLSVVTLRYFNVFGPHQDPDGEYAAVIPSFVNQMLDGRSPTVYGNGQQTRDFCHIDNVVSANLLACSADNVDGQVMNIACGQQTSVLDLIAHLNTLLGTSIEPVFAPARLGDVMHSFAGIERAREFLDYQPLVNFSEGLRRTVAWYRRHN